MAFKKFGNNFGNKLLNLGYDEETPKRAKKIVEKSNMPEQPSPEELDKFVRGIKKQQEDVWKKPMPLKDMPEFTDSSGKVNPKYKASRGEGAIAGGQAAGSIMNGNPFHDLFASIGGVIGGAINTKGASKIKYEEDVKQTMMQNQTTEANQRMINQAEQARIAAEREKRQLDTAIFNQNVKQKTMEAKTLGDKSKFLIEAAKNAPSEEQRTQLNGQFMKLWELDGDPSGDFGQDYKIEKIGDYAFLFDKNTGELKNAKGEDGKPISVLNTKQQLDALAAWTKLGDKDAPTLEESLVKADEYITRQFKGGLKPAQYNSLKLQLAKQIISNKESGSSSGKVIVNGEVIPIPDLPILGQQTTKPMEQIPASNDGSLFTPNETNPNAGIVNNGLFDKDGIVKVPVGSKTTEDTKPAEGKFDKIPIGEEREMLIKGKKVKVKREKGGWRVL